ncbi:CbaC protein [Halobacteria archaeon AArc-dxtr1]|nr:CbaC protein [Halobacteria archaeon AArc-dxtr1]
MRISKGALLVALALSTPFIVELRVVFGWFGIEISAIQMVAIGALVFAVILVWAFLPGNGNGNGGSGPDPSIEGGGSSNN